MSVTTAILEFVGSIALIATSSAVLSRRIEQVGQWLGLSEALLGMVTALGADAPEIASAVAALLSGKRDMGLGVIMGSNIFNLAALLGLSAVVAGRVRASRRGLLLNGGVAVWMAAAAGALVLKAIPGWLAVTLAAIVLVPYVALAALGPDRIRGLPLPIAATDWLARANANVGEDRRPDQTAALPSWADALAVAPLLATVVIASFGMVRSAAFLGRAWGVPHVIVGMLVLATLTGIPNLIAAIRLALHGRGSAVVTEAFNSNSLNLIAGILVPAVTVGLGSPSRTTVIAVWWLLAMTIGAAVLALARHGLHRLGGSALIVVYAAFVAVVILFR